MINKKCTKCGEDFDAWNKKEKICFECKKIRDYAKYPRKISQRESLIVELTKEYGFRCWYCGYRFTNNREVNIDHKVPYSSTQDNSYKNMALSCKFCNSHKFYYSIESFLKYIAYIRTGSFECPILKDKKIELDPLVRDILSKSFYI